MSATKRQKGAKGPSRQLSLPDAPAPSERPVAARPDGASRSRKRPVIRHPPLDELSPQPPDVFWLPEAPTPLSQHNAFEPPASPTAKTLGPSARWQAQRARRGEGRRRTYVYGVIDGATLTELGPIGLGETPSLVYAIGLEDIAALVSDVPFEAVDPTHENVLAHERVNQHALRTHAVVPMAFGTVFQSQADVLSLLQAARATFREALDGVRDKREFGLQVLWDREQVLAEIEREDQGLRRLAAHIKQQGATHLARLHHSRLVEGALLDWSARHAAHILARLDEVSVASRTSKPVGDRMILNAAFLVDRSDEQAFDERVRELGAQYAPLLLRLSGPWAPYNFVSVKLTVER